MSEFYQFMRGRGWSTPEVMQLAAVITQEGLAAWRSSGDSLSCDGKHRRWLNGRRAEARRRPDLLVGAKAAKPHLLAQRQPVRADRPELDRRKAARRAAAR